MQKKLTVLLSAYSCGPNHGSEPEIGWQNVVQLSKYCNIKVLTTNTFKKSIEKEINALNIKNIQFIYFDLPYFLNFLAKNQPWGMMIHYYIWQYYIYKIIKKYSSHKKIDIIHHITFNSFIFPGFWYKLKTPYILGPLGGTVTVAKKFYSLLSPSEKFQENLRKILKNYFKKNYILLNYFKNANKLIFANKSIACEFKKIPSAILLDVGVSSSLIKRKKYQPEKDKLDIIWAGLLNYRKGLVLLLQAMKKLREKNISLEVYGSGKKIQEYKKYITKFNLASKVKLKGNIPHKELLKKYSEYDLFIFTSLRDTSGSVVLEAMAAGLPIICLNHQGIKDIMETGNCGITIEPKNPEYVVDKIVEAILYYKKNQSKIKEHGLNAQKHIKNKYTWGKRTKKIYKLYREIVKEKL